MKACLPMTLILTASFAHCALAAEWSVEKNEEDPFDKSRATFIAGTLNEDNALAIRCLEGTITLLVVSGPSNASAGDHVDLKIVADKKDVQAEDAEVIASTTFQTAVQFGDDSTLSYLEGTEKIFIRYNLANTRSTVSFSGGRPLNDVIERARKACGLETSAPTITPNEPQVSASPACEAQFHRMKKAGDLGPDPDEVGFLAWCSKQAAKHDCSHIAPKDRTLDCAP